MSDENDNGRPSAPGGRPPLSLKPRGAGSVSAGTVKQSFSHGRSKTVVVETKRTRTHTPAQGNLAGPSAAERRHDAPRGPAPSGGQRPAPAQAGGLSSAEQQARKRAIELARQNQLRQAAERRAREERARAEAEAAARAEAAAQAARAAEAAAQQAPAPAAPTPAPVEAAPQP